MAFPKLKCVTAYAKGAIRSNLDKPHLIAKLKRAGLRAELTGGQLRIQCGEEIWEFVRYERIPQEVIGRDRFGQLVKTVQYIKIPAGKLAITFIKNLVASLEQTEGSIEGAARVKIVAAPFTVVY